MIKAYLSRTDGTNDGAKLSLRHGDVEVAKSDRAVLGPARVHVLQEDTDVWANGHRAQRLL